MSKQESNQETLNHRVHGYPSSWSLQAGSSNQNIDDRRNGDAVGLAVNESYSDLTSPSSPLTPLRSPNIGRGRQENLIQVIDTVLALLDDAPSTLDGVDGAPFVGSSNTEPFSNIDSPDEDDFFSSVKRH